MDHLKSSSNNNEDEKATVSYDTKSWNEWITIMSKFEKKFWTRMYCKFLLLPFTCESQSGTEKPDDKRNIFTMWQEFLTQYWGKYRWILLLNIYHWDKNYWRKLILSIFSIADGVFIGWSTRSHYQTSKTYRRRFIYVHCWQRSGSSHRISLPRGQCSGQTAQL